MASSKNELTDLRFYLLSNWVLWVATLRRRSRRNRSGTSLPETIICAVIFAIPGLPKDMTCYRFGVSTIPFWVFAVVSTLARTPHTWVLSLQGAPAASGEYLELPVLTAE